MVKPSAFFLHSTLLLLYIHLALSAAPEPSPSPAADSPSLHSPPSPYPALPPSSDSSISSPPAPPPSSSDPPTLASAPAPVNSPASDAPTPSPADADGVNHSNNVEAGETAGGERPSGMSGGKKAGIVFGVFIAAGLIAGGGFVYKKRQDNLRRSQYSYAARRELL